MESIPKIIHYCWFGNGNMPKESVEYIKSWKKYLPEYKIIEWNETNFDININRYVKEAYDNKKFAFVSDYARLKALYENGGIYFDTDVEVLKSFDAMLDEKCFLGFEEQGYIATSVIGSIKNHTLIKEFMDGYDNKAFVKKDGAFDTTTNVSLLTDLLIKYGLKLNGKKQILQDVITIYPREFFSPYDYINCRSYINKDSFSIHHFSLSWLPRSAKVKRSIKKIVAGTFGGELIYKIRKAFSKA